MHRHRDLQEMNSMNESMALDRKARWPRLIVQVLLLIICFLNGVTSHSLASGQARPEHVKNEDPDGIAGNNGESAMSEEHLVPAGTLPGDLVPQDSEAERLSSNLSEDLQHFADEWTTNTSFKRPTTQFSHSDVESIDRLPAVSITDRNSSRADVKTQPVDVGVREDLVHFSESTGDKSSELHSFTTGSKSLTTISSSPTPLPYLRLAYSKSGTRWMSAPVARPSTPALSCSNRCGDQGISVTDRAETGEVNHQCYCDDLCSLLKDCCQDFFSLCQKLSTVNGIFLYLFVEVPRIISFIGHQLWQASFEPYAQPDHTTAGLHRYGSCHVVNYLENNRRKTSPILLIDKCVDNFPETDVVEECENGTSDALFAFPVSHRWQLALTFKNIFCALCQDVGFPDILLWRVHVSCRPGDVIDLGSNATFPLLRELVNSNTSSCSSHTLPIIPPGARPRFCTPDKQTRRCRGDFLNSPGNISPAGTEESESDLAYSEAESSPERESFGQSESETEDEEDNFLPEEVAELCNSYISPVLIEDVVYANPHCALCNHLTPGEIHLNHSLFNNDEEEEEEDEKEKETTTLPSSSTVVAVSEISFESGELLYTLNGEERIRTHDNQCPGNDLLTLFFPGCRETPCPEGLYPSRCSGLGLDCTLSRNEKVCALKRFRFTGDTLATSITGDDPGSVSFYFSLELFVPEGEKPVLDLITSELLNKAFDDTMKHHCNCRRPPWVKLETAVENPPVPGSGARVWQLILKWYSPKHLELRYIRYLSFYLNSYLGHRASVSVVSAWNTESGGGLCEEKAEGMLELSAFAMIIGMDVFLQSSDHDFDYDLRAMDMFCLFDARRVAFKTSAVNLISYSYTDSFFLCWSQELVEACGIENTAHSKIWGVDERAMGSINFEYVEGLQDLNDTGFTHGPLTLSGGTTSVLWTKALSSKLILVGTATSAVLLALSTG